jgi:fatty acid desaturase
MGIYQQRLGVMGHEAVHHLLSRNRRVNDFVGNVFCFWPLGTSVLGYRRFHFMHHKFTNVSSDPEWKHTKTGPWDTPMSGRQMVIYLFKDLLGLSWNDTIATIKLTHPPTLRSFLGPIAFAVTLIAVSVATGNIWLPFVWYGGLYTSSWAVLRWRIWFEHIGAANTHRVHFPWLARCIISPHNIWVHWEHHKYSSIPYWNLLKVRSIDSSESVLAFGEVGRGFSRLN